MSFDDSFDGWIDFEKVKPLVRLAEGEYVLKITDWELVQPKKEETKSKGLNLRVKFKLSDPTVEIDGEFHDLSDFQTNDQIFFMFENPFALVPLVAAVKRLDKDDPKALGGVNIRDKSEWLGEEVIGRLVRTEDQRTGKFYLNPVSEAYLPVPF